MSKPFANKSNISSRQRGVSLVVRIENRDFITEVSKLLRHVHDISKILLRIKKVEGEDL
jgi:DNA mismatch repair ATPase MutS